MHCECADVIELGRVSANTLGLLIGLVESEMGFMRLPSLDAD
jgi:hypothetical protein